MKPAALLARLLELACSPYERRHIFAMGASHGLLHAARIVATLAPADAVQTYVHTVMKGERNLERWKLAFTTGGGLMPTLFMAAGWYLCAFSNPWWIVGAQLAWLVVWGFIGLPWLFCTLDEHQLELRANALTALCQTTNATQEQLNRAARRLNGDEEKTAP